MEKESIKDHAERLLKLGSKKADFVLINISRSISEAVIIKNDSVDGFDFSESCNYIVHLWKDGKKGTSSGNKFSLDLVNKALKIAKINKKLECFYGLPSKAKAVFPNNFDKKIVNLDEEKLAVMSNSLIEDVKTAKVALSEGGVEKEHSFSLTINSNNVKIGEESTSLAVYADATARTKDKVSTSWDSRHECYFFKFDKLARHVRQECLDFLKPEKLKKKVKNVILKPEPLSDLLIHAFLANFNAKNVEKKQSCLVNKLGRKIFDKDFYLNDNGILSKGVNSSAVDFEGHAHRDTKLVEKGVLKSFVYDYNTARHSGRESTGNASSNGIGFTNVVLNGKYEPVDKALIVSNVVGAHTSNPLTTDFSVNAENCYYYKNGEKIPVKAVMLSGNMLNVLSRIVSVGKKKEQRNGVYAGSLVSDRVNVIRS